MSEVGSVEVKNEKWYSFKRVYCKEGFIDYWMGDSADDPNRDEKRHYNLNSFSQFFRLNGDGEWVSAYSLGRHAHYIGIHELREVFTSEEIWNQYLNPSNAKD